MQQRIVHISIFIKKPKLIHTSSREYTGERQKVLTKLQLVGSLSESSKVLQSFMATLRDRLPTSGASVNAPDAYKDRSKVESPNDPNPSHMLYKQNMNNINIEVSKINKRLLDFYSHISFLNTYFLPEMEWIPV
jgi:hypothetical protein